MGVRFYAAAPLVTHDGYRLGTMNIIDFTPREFDSEGERTLHRFAGLVMDQMELRLSARKAIATLSKIFLGAERPKDLHHQCMEQGDPGGWRMGLLRGVSS